MRRMRFGTSFAVFVLFFGIATLEAFETRDWLKTAFWLLIAAVFLYADRAEKAPTIPR